MNTFKAPPIMTARACLVQFDYTDEEYALYASRCERNCPQHTPIRDGVSLRSRRNFSTPLDATTPPLQASSPLWLFLPYRATRTRLSLEPNGHKKDPHRSQRLRGIRRFRRNGGMLPSTRRDAHLLGFMRALADMHLRILVVLLVIR